MKRMHSFLGLFLILAQSQALAAVPIEFEWADRDVRFQVLHASTDKVRFDVHGEEGTFYSNFESEVGKYDPNLNWADFKLSLELSKNGKTYKCSVGYVKAEYSPVAGIWQIPFQKLNEELICTKQ